MQGLGLRVYAVEKRVQGVGFRGWRGAVPLVPRLGGWGGGRRGGRRQGGGVVACAAAPPTPELDSA